MASGSTGTEDHANVSSKRKQLPWDFSEYIQEKKRKLNQQFEEMGDRISTIFNGVNIYVNGFTEPSDTELKKLIYLHGGNYSYKYSSDVTHVIATSIPDVKIKNMPNVVAVSPRWILDSLEAKKLMHTEKYRLYSAKPKNQQRLPLDKGSQPSSLTPQHKSSDDLVSEFYSHSRLHHLSTWASELKQYVSTSIANNSSDLPSVPESESLKSKCQSAIVHFDFDCFFVSASIRDSPELKGKPVVVTHAKLSNKATMTSSMADIASCNYEARERGICNGMHIGKAVQICPELIAVPYDFNTYHEVSLKFYDTLLSRTHNIEAVSCDEAYVDFSNHARTWEEVADIVQSIRSEVREKTRCNLSAGIGPNILLARLATRKAKPNGQYVVSLEDVAAFMAVQRIENLPGVGYNLCRKLNEKSIFTCKDMKSFSLGDMKGSFGPKTGQMLYDFARGKDKRTLQVSPERKSLSAEMNFGIRPKTIGDVESIIESLSSEVEKRASSANVRGALVILKLKVRSKDAPVSARKYLGHGLCDNISRSISLPNPTRSAVDLNAACLKLLHMVNPSAESVRGLGIQIAKLTEDVNALVNQQRSLKKFMLLSTKQPSKDVDVKEILDTHRLEVFCSQRSEKVQSCSRFGQRSADSVIGCCESKTTFKELQVYLQGWFDNTSTSGPSNGDVIMFAEYCVRLLTVSLEGVYLLLQWFRSAVVSRYLSAWYSGYNSILEQVNCELSRSFGGVLKIDYL